MVGLENCFQGADQRVVLPNNGSSIRSGEHLIADAAPLLTDMDQINMMYASDDGLRNVIEQGVNDLQRMIERATIKLDGTTILLFCRDIDSLVDVPAYGLRDIIEMRAHNAFENEKKARNFFRLKMALEQMGMDYRVFTKFDEALKAITVPLESEGFYDDKEQIEQIKNYSPLTFVIFKLFQFSDWFEERPLKERASLILKRDVISRTVLDVLNPLKEEVKKYGEGSRIVIFGPSDLKRYRGYDFHRAMFENTVYREAERNYRNDGTFEFVGGKSLVTLFRCLNLRGGYKN